MAREQEAERESRSARDPRPADCCGGRRAGVRSAGDDGHEARAEPPAVALQRRLGNQAVQRLAEGERGESDRTGSSIEGGLEREIRSLRGGRSLPEATRSFFEPRFGADLDGVRVHTGSRADGLARSLNARAFAVGSDLVFRDGAYRPATAAGRRLLAHELAHTVQQGAVGRTAEGPAGSRPTVVQRQDDEGESEDEEDLPILERTDVDEIFERIRAKDGALYERFDLDEQADAFEASFENAPSRLRFHEVTEPGSDGTTPRTHVFRLQLDAVAERRSLWRTAATTRREESTDGNTTYHDVLIGVPTRGSPLNDMLSGLLDDSAESAPTDPPPEAKRKEARKAMATRIVYHELLHAAIEFERALRSVESAGSAEPHRAYRNWRGWLQSPALEAHRRTVRNSLYQQAIFGVIDHGSPSVYDRIDADAARAQTEPLLEQMLHEKVAFRMSGAAFGRSPIEAETEAWQPPRDNETIVRGYAKGWMKGYLHRIQRHALERPTDGEQPGDGGQSGDQEDTLLGLDRREIHSLVRNAPRRSSYPDFRTAVVTLFDAIDARLEAGTGGSEDGATGSDEGGAAGDGPPDGGRTGPDGEAAE